MVPVYGFLGGYAGARLFVCHPERSEGAEALHCTPMTTPTMKDVAPWVERMARIGYAAKALLYITVGVVSAQAGLGRGGRITDTQGAMRVVHHVSYGRIVLGVIAAGLIGYAVWRLIEAVVDPDNRGTDMKGVLLRISFAVRGLFHGALGITALRLAASSRTAPHTDQTRHWASRAFELPAGQLLVWAAALSLLGYGLYQLYRAYASKLSKQLRLGELAPSLRRWIIGVSRFGIGARGVVFALIGFLLARAAARHSAAEAGGVRKSLGLVVEIGRWPFVAVALGLTAYGVYELVNARYRDIKVA
jgi:hypothetical protein